MTYQVPNQELFFVPLACGKPRSSDHYKFEHTKVVELRADVLELAVETEAGLPGQLAVYSGVPALACGVQETDVQHDVHRQPLIAQQLLDDENARVGGGRLAHVLEGPDDVLVGEVVEHVAELVDERAAYAVRVRLEHAAAHQPGPRQVLVQVVRLGVLDDL